MGNVSKLARSSHTTAKTLKHTISPNMHCNFFTSTRKRLKGEFKLHSMLCNFRGVSNL